MAFSQRHRWFTRPVRTSAYIVLCIVALVWSWVVVRDDPRPEPTDQRVVLATGPDDSVELRLALLTKSDMELPLHVVAGTPQRFTLTATSHAQVPLTVVLRELKPQTPEYQTPAFRAGQLSVAIDQNDPVSLDQVVWPLAMCNLAPGARCSVELSLLLDADATDEWLQAESTRWVVGFGLRQ